MKRLSLLLSFIMAFAACATVRLERGLPKDIRDFYDQHWIIMETRVPKTIDAKQPLERDYFLRLPEPLQRRYIQQFWAIREIDMHQEYAMRFAVVCGVFRGEGQPGWRTDRGRIMLLCGQPDEAFPRGEDGKPYMEGEEEWAVPGKKFFKVWGYWWGTGFAPFIELWFSYDANRCWRFIEPIDAQVQDFMQYWRWRMAPTKDGWEAWAAEVGK